MNPDYDQNAPGGQEAYKDFKALTVKEILFFLAQVSQEFAKQPRDYNEFLNIMELYCRNYIKIKHVNKQVSILFKGHPRLIMGFNAFLPPAYKIEVELDNMVNSRQPSQGSVPMRLSQPSQGSVHMRLSQPSQGSVPIRLSQPSQGSVPMKFSQPSQGPVSMTFSQPSQGPVPMGFSQPSQGSVPMGFSQPSQGSVPMGLSQPDQGPLPLTFYAMNAIHHDPGVNFPPELGTEEEFLDQMLFGNLSMYQHTLYRF